MIVFKAILLGVFFSAFWSTVYAQEDEKEIRQTLTNIETATAYIKKTYKVQIYIGNSHYAAVNRKKDFEKYFIHLPIALTYSKPNYKVRVGDFENIEDANEVVYLLRDCFKYVFTVPIYEKKIALPREKMMPITLIGGLKKIIIRDNNKSQVLKNHIPLVH